MAQTLTIRKNKVRFYIEEVALNEDLIDETYLTHCKEFLKLISMKNNLAINPSMKNILETALHLIFKNNMPIPMKTCWVEPEKYDFHFYCANLFWPTMYSQFLNSVQRAVQRSKKPNRVVVIDKKTKGADECQKRFETQSAAKRHNLAFHDEDCFYDSDDDSDNANSETDSEDESKWHFSECQKCDKISLTEKTREYHIERHGFSR